MKSLYLICKIADVEYAIPAGDVYQMESYKAATPVPGSASFVSGLIQIRQQVIPVIDARLRFGFAAQDPTPDSRFVVLKIDSRLVAILVDSAREVRTFSEDEFTSPPALTGEGANRFVKSVAQLKDRIVLLIDSSKVVGKEMING